MKTIQLKKVFPMILFSLCFMTTWGQEKYGNEWIDFDKTYYEFKMYKNGIYRIYYSDLVDFGIDSNKIIGKDFQVFTRGEEIPLYTSSEAKFSKGDFVEFYGEKNDGRTDIDVYMEPEHQPHQEYSLYSDTISYFLTFEDSGPHKRIKTLKNKNSNNLPAEEYYKKREIKLYKDGPNEGQAPVSYYPTVHDSRIMSGEAFVGGDFNFDRLFNGIITVSDLYQNSTEEITLSTIGFSIDQSPSTGKLKIGSTEDFFETDFQDIFRVTTIVPKEDLVEGNNLVGYSSIGEKGRYRLFKLELNYPRKFEFKLTSDVYLEIQKTNEVHIELNNWRTISVFPNILYDLENGTRIIDSIATDGVAFTLPKVAKRNGLFVASSHPSFIKPITEFERRNFTDYSKLQHQGGFIFLTHERLNQALEGVNYIDEYVKYRESLEGGDYNVVRVDVRDLQDQFIYGIPTHPLAIRRFVNFAVDNWEIKPEQLFICGKGLNYIITRRSGIAFKINLIAPYGSPPSDNLLTARDAESSVPQLAVGRISVRDNKELRDYFLKIRDYEKIKTDNNSFNSNIKNSLWLKRFLMLAGGTNDQEQKLFSRYIENYKAIVEQPKLGAITSTINKTSTDPVQIANSLLLDSLINNGTYHITFFGHASASSLDFNIRPDQYKNYERYFIMLTNGCFIGDLYKESTSYSENIVLTPNKGAIAYIAPQSFSSTSGLNTYSKEYFRSMSNEFYGTNLGNCIINAAQLTGNRAPPLPRLIAQQMIVHGDPGLQLLNKEKPDYSVDENAVTFDPKILNTSVDSFQVNVKCINLGLAVDKDFTTTIVQRFQNGEEITFSKTEKAPFSDTTITFNIPTDRIKSIGQNSFIVTVDAFEEIEEENENNNQVTVNQFISSEEIFPIFPSEFCIVNRPPTLKFSSVNPLAVEATYLLEIDTTENFNSPLAMTNEITSKGGLIEWKPNIDYIENTVYYTRAAYKSTSEQNSYNYSSFLYTTTELGGWNQSHFFQFKKNNLSNLTIDFDRRWRYSDIQKSLYIHSGIWPKFIRRVDILSNVDGFLLGDNPFIKNGFLFYVYDELKGEELETFPVRPENPYPECEGTYGDVNCYNYRPRQIMGFPANNATERNKIRDFIFDVIPDNSVVFCYAYQNDTTPELWEGWELDDPNSTLIDAFEYLGARSFPRESGLHPYVLLSHLGNSNFPITEIVGDSNDIIDTLLYFGGDWDNGSMKSKLIGPAKSWKDFNMDFTPYEAAQNDSVVIDLYGRNVNGNFVSLQKSVPSSYDLTHIDASIYPWLQLEMKVFDETTRTPGEINHWKIHYDKAPEAVINQNINFVLSEDSIMVGNSISLSIAVENVSSIDMDSLLVKYTISNNDAADRIIYKRYAPLLGNSFIILNEVFNFNNNTIVGNSTLVIEINPDDDQIEQFHFNNFAVIPIYIGRDLENPILDVTFDGKHILNGDIVSPQPEILISLKDENALLALDDSNSLEIFIIDPDDQVLPQQISVSDENVELLAPDLNDLKNKNEIKLYYRPNFTKDGIYQLRVQGIDRSNNEAGELDYRIKFEIINGSAISNFINYPNPFSTSTRFIYTLTGRVIPDEINIQIYTISGRIVREISKEELGLINFGLNISEFEWDGTDQFGDQLANGVYLYKVNVKSSGEQFDKIETPVDSYIHKSIGKMYLLR